MLIVLRYHICHLEGLANKWSFVGNQFSQLQEGELARHGSPIQEYLTNEQGGDMKRRNALRNMHFLVLAFLVVVMMLLPAVIPEPR